MNINEQMMGIQAGLYQQRQKDPTVANAEDALFAMKKRIEAIRAQLAQVSGLEKELARLTKMVEAGE